MARATFDFVEKESFKMFTFEVDQFISVLLSQNLLQPKSPLFFDPMSVYVLFEILFWHSLDEQFFLLLSFVHERERNTIEHERVLFDHFIHHFEKLFVFIAELYSTHWELFEKLSDFDFGAF